MRIKRPRIARLDQVTISRNGEYAAIEFHDPTISLTQLKVGPQLSQMTDKEIVLLFNQTITAQMRCRDKLGQYIAIEIPVGSPQVKCNPDTVNQYSPKGGVLRCCIEDGGGEDGMLPVIHIDEQCFTWDEFGKMLCTYAGWGMRIAFVPEDELERAPKIVVQESDE